MDIVLLQNLGKLLASFTHRLMSTMGMEMMIPSVCIITNAEAYEVGVSYVLYVSD